MKPEVTKVTMCSKTHECIADVGMIQECKYSNPFLRKYIYIGECRYCYNGKCFNQDAWPENQKRRNNGQKENR
jgi:hypothetical protein